MRKGTKVNVNLQVLFMKEGETFICYSPALDLAAHGDSFEDAEKSFETTLQLFEEEVTKRNSWPQVLKEYGWEKVNEEWSPPVILRQVTKAFAIPSPN